MASVLSWMALTAALTGAAMARPGEAVQTVAGASRPLPSPITTKAPSPQLLRRQYDNICGWIDADILQSVTCSQGFACVQDSGYNLAGNCCRLANLDNCVLPTACVPSSAASLPEDPRVTTCTDANSRYCYTGVYATEGATPTFVGCTNAPSQTPYIYPSYTGYDYPFPASALYDVTGGNGNSGSGSDASVPTGGGGSGGTGSGSSGSGGSGGSSDSGNSSSGGASNSDPSEDSNSNGSGGGKSNNAGAIAGGVVGGVAVIGIIALLITWMVLRHRRRAHATGGPANSSVGNGQPVYAKTDEGYGNQSNFDGTTQGENPSTMESPIPSAASVAPPAATAPAVTSQATVAPAAAPAATEVPTTRPRAAEIPAATAPSATDAARLDGPHEMSTEYRTYELGSER